MVAKHPDLTLLETIAELRKQRIRTFALFLLKSAFRKASDSGRGRDGSQPALQH